MSFKVDLFKKLPPVLTRRFFYNGEGSPPVDNILAILGLGDAVGGGFLLPKVLVRLECGKNVANSPTGNSVWVSR